MVNPRRRVLLAVLGFLLVGGVVAVGFATGLIGTSGLSPAQLAQRAAAARARALLAAETKDVKRAVAQVAVALPSRRVAPAPTAPAALFKRPLAAHEVVDFVPYWLYQQVRPSEIDDSSVLVYSSVCVDGAGAIPTAGPDCAHGAADLDSTSFADFVAAAHGAGDRVLLSVESVDGAVIHALVTHPEATSSTLAAALAALVAAHHLDGIDIDLEGRAVTDREAFVHFIADLTARLRRAKPGGEIILDTFPQSASSPKQFFDVVRLAPYVDRFFVMDYQMESGNVSSANSPMASPDLGWSAVQALLQYERVVKPGKIILGLPFYGLNFETLDGKAGAPVLGAPPGTRLYSAIVAAGRPALWDPASLTPYAVFKDGTAWHQDWYDDPVSLALKTALAVDLHTAGVGAWALGMEGDDTQMLAALTGGTSPARQPLRGAAG